MTLARLARRGLLAAGICTVLLAAALPSAVDRVGVAPRTLAPYIEKRTSGHNPAIEGTGRRVAAVLMALDRTAGDAPLPSLALSAGAQAQPAGQDAAGTTVTTPDDLRAALRTASPGDVITLAPGTYRFQGKGIDVPRAGRADAPIVVRAARPGTVHIELETLEGFVVSAPYWRFENLDIRGVCPADDNCEHAFHVVGAGHHFASVNNTIRDFNAHIKINGVGNRYPDDGLIEHTTLTATHVRKTANPVTPIDLVTASGWILRANLISDFVKGDGNQVSYGAFAKGGGRNNVFERNVVWCEQALRGLPGQRVGLSLGGGGTGREFCRDSRCITEQEGSVLRANLVVGCSDAGIYLNGAAASKVVDNTLVDTTGIDVRYPTSSAVVDGNLVDGPVRARDGAIVHLGENRATPLWRSYLGSHPVRSLFRAPEMGDFSWRDGAPLRAEAAMESRPAD
ncbi:MAG: right-handed parallel beta-helix repeat-containing protein, partial [Massilia sp.]|nr:right-handed parallel beta-helix repeat-containing protein [Massilia sp.]